MNALAVALLGCAAFFADRSARAARRAEARRRSRGDAASPARRVRDVDVRAVGIVAVAGLCGLLVAGPLGGAVGAALGVGVRRLGRLRSRRTLTGRRDEQLADAVAAITAAVRSGMSVPQAIGYATRESEPPVEGELERLLADVDVGVPLGQAVDAWAERTGSEDAQLVAGALDLHRRSGGDLPAVLDQVAAAIRERVAVARETRALTAQARLSGWILGVLPIGFFAFLWLTSRQDMEGALRTPLGLGSVVLGLLLEVGAFVWIRSLLDVS